MQSAATAASVAMQEGHTSLSDELRKGKSKSRIRTRNPLQFASVSLINSCFTVGNSFFILPHNYIICRTKLKRQQISFLLQA